MFLTVSLHTTGFTDAVSPNALHSTPYRHHECSITGVTSYKRLKRQLGIKKRQGVRDTVISYNEQTVQILGNILQMHTFGKSASKPDLLNQR